MNNRFYSDFDKTLTEQTQPRPEEHRSPFQIDRDRILFSYAFRKLQSKTQVFQTGEYDFYHTRLTHSMEVARIARSICEYLRQKDHALGDDFYIDPDLCEAVGLAHDIGHSPFGHTGEDALNQLMKVYGGFEGNAQTLRLLTETIYERDEGTRGMRPTRALVDGILKYKKLLSEATEANHGEHPKNHFLFDEQKRWLDFCCEGVTQEARTCMMKKSIECQIMDWADDAAYSLHDIQDGLRGRFLNETNIRKWLSNKETVAWIEKDSSRNITDKTISDLISCMNDGSIEMTFSLKAGTFIKACSLKKRKNSDSVPTNRHKYDLCIEKAIRTECDIYKKLAFDLIFQSPQILQMRYKGDSMLKALFSLFFENYVHDKNHTPLLPDRYHQWICNAEKEKRPRLICDYIASLTDSQVIRLYKRLFDPNFGSIGDII